MKIVLNILLTPIVLVFSLPIAVFVAIFYFIKFPVDTITSLWDRE